MTQCDHATLLVRPGVISCGLRRFGGSPHQSVCRRCPDYKGPLRGAGDVVAAVTKAVGLRPCGGCQKRREWLNDHLPLGGAR